MIELKAFEPLKSNRHTISFNDEVSVPNFLFKDFKIKNEGDNFILKIKMYNTVNFLFNISDFTKITDVKINFLDPIGEIINGYTFPVKGTNIKLKCSYGDDGIMITKFRFIIESKLVTPLYNNTEKNGQ